ncbi:DUF4190 domain-containing protein [Microbacterium sp.]|uniref:DUF4190 domain-containing protein n=1 Tax=Microbacterium sp. TaxID=51671 RepID=UPI0039E45C66
MTDAANTPSDAVRADAAPSAAVPANETQPTLPLDPPTYAPPAAPYVAPTAPSYATAPAAAPVYQPPSSPASQPPAQGYATPPPYGAAQGYGTPQGYAAPQAGYGAPAYGAAPYAYAGPKTNTMSIVSMILSILGFVWVLPLIGGLVGAILGHMALGQIKRTGEGGRGLALTAIIVGWIGVGIVALFLIFILAPLFFYGTFRDYT